MTPKAMTPRRETLAEMVPSVCPHDCTSTCALEVERLDARTIGRVRGSLRNTYTRGVICEKVTVRRAHPPPGPVAFTRCGASGRRAPGDSCGSRGTRRSTGWRASSRGGRPRRTGDGVAVLLRGDDGTGPARRNQPAAPRHALFAVVLDHLRDAVGHRLGGRHGAKRGVDLREVGDHSDLVVIWGGNPVNTQVNVMTHAMAAKRRGATLVVVDPYRTAPPSAPTCTSPSDRVPTGPWPAP